MDHTKQQRCTNKKQKAYRGRVKMVNILDDGGKAYEAYATNKNKNHEPMIDGNAK